jgi:hypothetical protein
VKVVSVPGEQCATPADTSSAAAGTSATVGASAAICAALRSEPMVAKSVAADVSSGAAITYDMSDHLLASPLVVTSPAVLQPSEQKDFRPE